MKIKAYFIVLTFLLALSNCSSRKQKEKLSLVQSYNPSIEYFSSQFKLFARNDSSFVLFYILKKPKYQGIEAYLPQKLLIECVSATNNKEILEKFEIPIEDKLTDEFSIQEKFEFSINDTAFNVKVDVVNSSSKVLTTFYDFYRASNKFHEYYFYENNQFLFQPYLVVKEKYSIFSYTNKINSFCLASDTLHQKEILTIPYEWEKGNELLLFYSDTEFVFSKYLLSADDLKLEEEFSLAPPLQLFNTHIELNDSTKHFIDEFWLETSNFDVNKAKELIRVFYNRVKLANRYFTSYKKGWNTDRGKIYILLGLPDNVKQGANAEIWTYFSKKQNTVANLRFEKNYVNRNSNDFEVADSISFNNLLSKAKRSWTNGTIYYY